MVMPTMAFEPANPFTLRDGLLPTIYPHELPNGPRSHPARARQRQLSSRDDRLEESLGSRLSG
jgi:hypothetical protein